MVTLPTSGLRRSLSSTFPSSSSLRMPLPCKFPIEVDDVDASRTGEARLTGLGFVVV